MQLIRISETAVNLLFPDGYEIFLDGRSVAFTAGDFFEFAGTHYIVGEIRHKFLIPEDKVSLSDRTHMVVVVLVKHTQEGLFCQNPDGTETRID
jgi:hypothetical protein